MVMSDKWAMLNQDVVSRRAFGEMETIDRVPATGDPLHE